MIAGFNESRDTLSCVCSAAQEGSNRPVNLGVSSCLQAAPTLKSADKVINLQLHRDWFWCFTSCHPWTSPWFGRWQAQPKPQEYKTHQTLLGSPHRSFEMEVQWEKQAGASVVPWGSTRGGQACGDMGEGPFPVSGMWCCPVSSQDSLF